MKVAIIRKSARRSKKDLEKSTHVSDKVWKPLLMLPCRDTYAAGRYIVRARAYILHRVGIETVYFAFICLPTILHAAT